MFISADPDTVTEDDLLSRAEAYLDQHEISDPDEEALGAAIYLEEAVSGERDNVGPLADYMVKSEDFDFESFIDYKSEMGNDFSRFPGEVSGVLDEMGRTMRRNEAIGSIYQALYEEARSERNSAGSALSDILDDVSSRETGSHWPDNIDLGTRKGRETGYSNFMSPIFNFGKMESIPSGGYMSPIFNFGDSEMGHNSVQSWDDYDWGGWSQIREPEVERPSEIFGQSEGYNGFGETLIYNPQVVSGDCYSGSEGRQETNEDFFDGFSMPWNPKAS